MPARRLKKKKKIVKKLKKMPKKEVAKPEEGKKEKKERKETAEELEEEVESPEEKEELVTLNYRALSKILKHGMRFSNPNIPRAKWVECMGFLVGNVNEGKVEIKDAIPMVHGSLVEVEFQDEHYVKADEINQNLTDENWVIGWYHTHPGHGLFLSAVDKINHSGYQTLNSKAIALVFDPSKFDEKSKLEEYINIFRLKYPELREKSGFIEIESIEVIHPLQEVIASIYESSMLSSKEYPLVLEYGEDYEKPEPLPQPSIAEEPESMEKNIKEMRIIMKKMHKEIKLLHSRLQGHMETTKKAVELLGKGSVSGRRKGVTKCEFCGYDGIMPGDRICANCGKNLD
jgi:26S proteasome regulatory subunit N11